MVSLGRKTGVIVALGALFGSVLVEGTADAASRVVVSTTKNTKLGTILVSHKTLYTLKPSKTPCSAACLKIWPALTLPKGVNKAVAGTGVSASKLGAVKRNNGTHQVTYAGKPLYWFVGDTAAGQVHGNITDTWGKWSVVVTARPTNPSSGTSSGSGSTSTGSGSGSGSGTTSTGSGSGSGSGSGGSTAGSGGVSF
jgi:predicted lipoprotein with Yx(FWY)xxD motif